ncbi:MAG: DNA-processing protein DprA [Pseudomonadota bacterium]
MKRVGPRSTAEEFAWLRLIRSENIGPATFFDLLDRFGTAAAALDALPEIAERAGSKRPIRIAKADAVERELARAKRADIAAHYYGGPGYTERLMTIHSPPPVLMVRGSVDILSRTPLAIVGARKASAAGRTLARNFAGAFGAAGRTVVSGLALGVDGEAHRAALVSGTVAVVAGGTDRPTPDEHVDLADEIVAAGGAVLSEMPLGVTPHARDFPRRNRLIAGLSDAVVIVEAAAHSGSLHTARYASDQNREVFAIPGSPLDPRAAGSLQLLRDGASLAIEPRDVLDGVRIYADAEPRLPGFAEPDTLFDYQPPAPEADATVADTGGDAMDRITEALSITPVAVDDIVRATGIGAASVLGALVELEIAGHAVREPDGTVRAALPTDAEVPADAR